MRNGSLRAQPFPTETAVSVGGGEGELPQSGKRGHLGVRATKGSGCSPNRWTERTEVCEDEAAAPLIGSNPLGNRLRAGRGKGPMRASAPTCGLPQQYLARRTLWTLPSPYIRPRNGSGCWGARVCKLRAPEMNGKHPRQNRGMEKGVSPFSLLLLGGVPRTGPA